VEAEQSDLIVMPWQQEANNSDCSAAILSLLSSAHQAVTLGVYVDRQSFAAIHNMDASNGIGYVPPFSSIAVPFTSGSSNDRAAVQMALRMRRNANSSVRLTVIHLQCAAGQYGSISPIANGNGSVTEKEKDKDSIGKGELELVHAVKVSLCHSAIVSVVRVSGLIDKEVSKLWAYYDPPSHRHPHPTYTDHASQDHFCSVFSQSGRRSDDQRTRDDRLGAWFLEREGLRAR